MSDCCDAECTVSIGLSFVPSVTSPAGKTDTLLMLSALPTGRTVQNFDRFPRRANHAVVTTMRLFFLTGFTEAMKLRSLTDTGVAAVTPMSNETVLVAFPELNLLPGGTTHTLPIEMCGFRGALRTQLRIASAGDAFSTSLSGESCNSMDHTFTLSESFENYTALTYTASMFRLFGTEGAMN